MAVTEIILQRGPEMSSTLPHSNLRRDPAALAASIASLSQANGMAPEQVASMWVVQKGLQFVDLLLKTPTYEGMSKAEKARIRTTAAQAFRDDLVERLGFTAPTRGVDDKRWGFWNAGYSVL